MFYQALRYTEITHATTLFPSCAWNILTVPRETLTQYITLKREGEGGRGERVLSYGLAYSKVAQLLLNNEDIPFVMSAGITVVD